MDRDDAKAYAIGEHGTMLDELGISTTDNVAGIKGILDRAGRSVGVAQSDLAAFTIADDTVEKMEAALDYYTLLKASREAANRVKIAKTTGDEKVEKDFSQYFDHIGALLKDAKACAQSLGVLVDGSSGFEWGALNLDILEPAGV